MPAYHDWSLFISDVSKHARKHASDYLFDFGRTPTGAFRVRCVTCSGTSGDPLDFIFETSTAVMYALEEAAEGLTGPGEYHHATSGLDLLLCVRGHVEAHHAHVVRYVDDPDLKNWGYACQNCRTTWTISYDDWLDWFDRGISEHTEALRLLFQRPDRIARVLNSQGAFFGTKVDRPETTRSVYECLLDDDDESHAV